MERDLGFVAHDGVGAKGFEASLEEFGAAAAGLGARDAGTEGDLFGREGIEGIGLRGGMGRGRCLRGGGLGVLVPGAPREGEEEGGYGANELSQNITKVAKIRETSKKEGEGRETAR